MRNPLSAILQSVDEVSDHLSLALASASADISSTQSSIEAVETIALCCQHQRRVIDDVLTLSKMNTNMLQINLDESDPLKVVSGVIRIFSGDAKKQGISLTTEVEDSMKEMDINHLLFDPGRLSQVLVNLLGNAIKFTRDCDVRKIKVTVGTFASRPPPDDHGVDYVEPDFRNSDGTKANDDDENRQIYLRIVVQDTGIGMSNEEKLKLFKRFAQGVWPILCRGCTDSASSFSTHTYTIWRIRTRSLHFQKAYGTTRWCNWSEDGKSHRNYLCVLCQGITT